MALSRTRRTVPISLLTALLCLLAYIPEGHALDESVYDATVASEEVPLGDVNRDGVTDIVDALIIAQHAAGQDTGRDLYTINSDVNGDLQIDIVDALLIARYAGGLIEAFPVESTAHEFTDPMVEAAVRAALGKDDTVPIDSEELRRIRALTISCDVGEIREVSLADIEAMLGLTYLKITSCTLPDLTPLSRLVGLQAAQRKGSPESDPDRPEWAPELLGLDLFASRIDQADYGPLAALNPLRDLDLSWTIGLDPALLDGLEALESLDIRGTNITDTSALDQLPYLDTILTGRNIANCGPGSRIGDANQDGVIDGTDVHVVNTLLLPLFRYYGGPSLSDNIGCIDVDANGRVDANDAALIQDIADGFASSPGVLGITCSSQSIVGDADGDGAITARDANLLQSLLNDEIPITQNVCCVDVNGDGWVDSRDVAALEDMADDPELVPSVCEGAQSGVGVVTYELRAEFSVIAAGGGGEPLDVPMPIIEELHHRVVTNPFLAKADVVLLPEFAYSSRVYPVAFTDNGEGASPRYVISEQDLSAGNEVALMLQQLQQIAAENRVAIVVPLAEAGTVDDQYGQPCPILWDSAVIIENTGNIQHIRRKTNYDVLCRDGFDAELEGILRDIALSSFQVFELETRDGQPYEASVVICAEISRTMPDDPDQRTVYNKMLEMAAQGAHPDLLLYTSGSAVAAPGDEAMKRFQYFDISAIHHANFGVIDAINDYAQFADYVAFSGLATAQKRPQGIFDLAHEPPAALQHIFTERFEQQGYLYARVDVLP